MDDIIILHHSKDYLKSVLMCLEIIANQNLRLEFNKKTQIFPIKNGVEYLGFRFFLSDSGKVFMKLKNQTKKKYKKRIKKLQEEYACGEKIA